VLELDLDLHRSRQVCEPLCCGEVLDGDDRSRVAGLLLERRRDADLADAQERALRCRAGVAKLVDMGRELASGAPSGPVG
jgi:hypothetical protein